jgi:hypothetical protein
MTRLCYLLLASLVATAPCEGQTATVPSGLASDARLILTKTVTTNQMIPDPRLGRATCNVQGTLYFRSLQDRATRVYRLDGDGQFLPPLIFDEAPSRIQELWSARE